MAVGILVGYFELEGLTCIVIFLMLCQMDTKVKEQKEQKEQKKKGSNTDMRRSLNM